MDKDYLSPDLPGNPEGGPGQLDQFVLVQFASPWQEQKARMLKPFALTAFTAINAPGIKQVFTMGEIPSWWVIDVQQNYIDGGTNGLWYGLLTIQQGGEKLQALIQPGSPDPSTAYPPGPPLKIIVKGHEANLTVTIDAINPSAAGGNVSFVGNVWAVGAGVDPSKVGVIA